jgi:hypothetical protein
MSRLWFPIHNRGDDDGQRSGPQQQGNAQTQEGQGGRQGCANPGVAGEKQREYDEEKMRAWRVPARLHPFPLAPLLRRLPTPRPPPSSGLDPRSHAAMTACAVWILGSSPRMTESVGNGFPMARRFPITPASIPVSALFHAPIFPIPQTSRILNLLPPPDGSRNVSMRARGGAFDLRRNVRRRRKRHGASRSLTVFICRNQAAR